MLNDFQSAVEEEKKRKLPFLNEVANLMPGAQRGQETGRLVSEAYDKGGVMSAAGMGLRRAPGDIAVGLKEMLIDPINKPFAPWINAAADVGKTAITGEVTPKDQKLSVLETNQNNLRDINSRPDRIGQGTRVVERNMLPSVNIESPKINETSNAQRDAELGKMTASINGNTTTYDIGGNTLSFEGTKDNQTKTNLERINPNGIQRVGNMDVSFDSSVSPEARKRFLENPVVPTGQMAQYAKYMNTPRGQNFGVTKIDNTPAQPMGWRTRKDLMLQELNNQQARENNLANIEEQRQRAAIDQDKNRIDEQRVNSENKLREIQGQVAQQPPVKETALKPMVIEEADPNDPTGATKRQRIMIPNAEGTGYVSGMQDQSAPNIAAKLTPQQKIKAVEYAKANPNIDKKIILQKIANGEI